MIIESPLIVELNAHKSFFGIDFYCYCIEFIEGISSYGRAVVSSDCTVWLDIYYKGIVAVAVDKIKPLFNLTVVTESQIKLENEFIVKGFAEFVVKVTVTCSVDGHSIISVAVFRLFNPPGVSFCTSVVAVGGCRSRQIGLKIICHNHFVLNRCLLCKSRCRECRNEQSG